MDLRLVRGNTLATLNRIFGDFTLCKNIAKDFDITRVMVIFFFSRNNIIFYGSFSTNAQRAVATSYCNLDQQQQQQQYQQQVVAANKKNQQGSPIKYHQVAIRTLLLLYF
jgi:hypothetical protein